MGSREEVTQQVRRFYESMPFNASAPADNARRIAAVDQVAAYPDLAAALDGLPAPDVLDLGCGGGWFALSLAYHRGLEVTGVDLSAAALAVARATAAELGVIDRFTFLERDLFDLGPGAHDVVNSIGVLHHTHDVEAALAASAALVGPRGWLHLGLYHAHGRPPFLSQFAPWLERGDTAGAFDRYRRLHREADDVMLRSWFRDQVLHPHERHLTLGEVDAVLDPLGFELRSSSLCGFGPVAEREELFAAESGQASLSRRRNLEEGRFFPGFFTALYRRRSP